MSDASHWHWKFCKECSYDDLLNEALRQFEEAERLRHKLLAKEDEIAALKKLNGFLEQQVKELKKWRTPMTQDEIDKMVKELEDTKRCCDCVYNFNGFCLFHGSITNGWNNCGEFKRKEGDIKISINSGV